MDGVSEELIARAKAGDREAFNEIVRCTYQRVHALALRLTGNEQDADDVVQDTYVRAFRGLRRFRGEARLSTWLHRITTNSASTFRDRRTRHAHRHLDDYSDVADRSPDTDPEAVAEQGAIGARLVSAVNSLPARLRSVVVLRDLHGLSHREIADRLQITESAAKVRLHRARARLRDLLVRDGVGRDHDEPATAPEPTVDEPDTAPEPSVDGPPSAPEPSVGPAALAEPPVALTVVRDVANPVEVPPPVPQRSAS